MQRPGKIEDVKKKAPSYAVRSVFAKLGATGFFKIPNIYTSFQLKLTTYCHKLTVDTVRDRVMLPKKR